MPTRIGRLLPKHSGCFCKKQKIRLDFFLAILKTAKKCSMIRSKTKNSVGNFPRDFEKCEKITLSKLSANFQPAFRLLTTNSQETLRNGRLNTCLKIDRLTAKSIVPQNRIRTPNYGQKRHKIKTGSNLHGYAFRSMFLFVALATNRRRMIMEIKSVFVYANEWHDRSAGNSYFSAETWINGKWVFTIPFSYGYGDFFVQAATARIRGFNILPIGKNESLYHFCLEHGIDLYTAKRSMRKNELAKKEMANIEFMNQLIEGKK